MAFKVVNDMAGLNGLVPTLFVFEVYPQVVIDSLLLLSFQQCIKTIQKVIIELRKTTVKCKIIEAF